MTGLFSLWCVFQTRNTSTSIVFPSLVLFHIHAHDNVFADYGDTPVATEVPASEVQAAVARMQRELFPDTARRLKAVQQRRKGRFDKRHRIVDIPVDAYVMLRDVERKSGMDPVHQGPYRVTSKTTAGTYALMDQEGQLLPHNYPTSALVPLSTLPRFEEPAYEVQAILAHRQTAQDYEYLVRWRHYGPEADTWEPTSSFNALEVIDRYWTRRGQQTGRE